MPTPPRGRKGRFWSSSTKPRLTQHTSRSLGKVSKVRDTSEPLRLMFSNVAYYMEKRARNKHPRSLLYKKLPGPYPQRVQFYSEVGPRALPRALHTVGLGTTS